MATNRRTLLIAACGEEETAPKEEAPASEQAEAKEKTVNAETFKKVNWDNYKKIDLEEIAPGFKQHESLKN